MEELIVADSSPLISFSRAGRLGLLQKLYGRVTVPLAVYEEVVVKGMGKPGAQDVAMANRCLMYLNYGFKQAVSPMSLARCDGWVARCEVRLR